MPERDQFGVFFLMEGPMRLMAVQAWMSVVVVGMMSSVAHAQVTSAVAGVVRDPTGAVLPGVTVETTSPVLIEKTRTAVTDAAGQYRIVDLRPGTYTLTFTLPGFTTFRQQGITLSPGFTATVHAELKLGDVAETITVSGEAPVVDVQNTRVTTVVSRQALDALPLGGQYQSVLNILPGVYASRGAANDVGGQLGQTFGTMAIHGSSSWDQLTLVDGHRIDAQTRGNPGPHVIDNNYEEFVVDLGGQMAETAFGGVSVNLVPRDGSNRFSGKFFANFTNGDLAATNIDDNLRRQGVQDPNTVERLWQVSPALGGPLQRDRVWFYATYTRQVTASAVTGSYYPLPNRYPLWEADFSRKGLNELKVWGATGRVTWQATPRNKITGYYDVNVTCPCPLIQAARGGSFVSPEAAEWGDRRGDIIQASWQSPLTNRLLLQASYMKLRYLSEKRTSRGTENVVQIVDNGIPKQYGSFGSTTADDNDKDSVRGAVSYVTGTHAIKVGADFQRHTNNKPTSRAFDYAYTALNGRPTAVTYYATPSTDIGKVFGEGGVFAQDQWTYRRLTLNYGGRFDFLRQGWPDLPLPATQLIPIARLFPETLVANFKDVSPRIGAAYDLFGTGKTALKASANRYVGVGLSGFQRLTGGVSALGTDTRSWNDANLDWIVQGDPLNPSANGELGPRTNGRFTEARFPRRYDPDFVNGWGTRPATNWAASGAIQQELREGVSATFGYYYRTIRTFEVVENAAVSTADYDPYCVTTPVDARLPGGGGQRLCGLNTLKSSAVGRTDLVTTSGDRFNGGQKESWRGFDVTLDARLARGVFLQGGVSTGKTTNDNCAYNEFPNLAWVSSLQAQVGDAPGGPTGSGGPGTAGGDRPTGFCQLETPFLTQIKLAGSYTLPWEVRVSGTLTSIPGPMIRADAVFTSAQLAQAGWLGRPLAGASTVTVGIIPTHTLYGDRRNQIDLRFGKSVRIGGRRVEGLIDVFNVLNVNTVTALNGTYGTNGATWQAPMDIVPPRLVKFGVQVFF